MRHVCTYHRDLHKGLVRFLKCQKNMGACLLIKSTCVLVSRNTDVVEGKADLNSYLKWRHNGPCVEKGIGFNFTFCSILVCCSVLSYSYF